MDRNLKETTIPGKEIHMQLELKPNANKLKKKDTGRIGTYVLSKGNHQRGMVRETLPIVLLRNRSNMGPDMRFYSKVARPKGPDSINP